MKQLFLVFRVCLRQHCVFAYKCVCMRIHMLIFLLFLILSVKEGTQLLTPPKITVFPGTKKIDLICKHHRTIPDICHLDHLYIDEEKIGHVEKFQILIHYRCVEI